jgi:hypothetical protein
VVALRAAAVAERFERGLVSDIHGQIRPFRFFDDALDGTTPEPSADESSTRPQPAQLGTA